MVNVCEQCGEAYDSTGYPVCQNCQFDTFIKLRKPHEETNNQRGKVMKEFKTGTLHSGKDGKVVKSKAQGLAIALSISGLGKKKGKK